LQDRLCHVQPSTRMTVCRAEQSTAQAGTCEIHTVKPSQGTGFIVLQPTHAYPTLRNPVAERQNSPQAKASRTPLEAHRRAHVYSRASSLVPGTAHHSTQQHTSGTRRCQAVTRPPWHCARSSTATSPLSSSRRSTTQHSQQYTYAVVKPPQGTVRATAP
jgi:hypothetical protein